MRALALAAFCAILSQCHARESALSRPKRTLRMLESLFGSMRDTFGPLTASAAQPPSEVILATKYPVGVKYALYPTVRMHIRPIQQHVIYMQSIPAMPAPVLRPVRPMNTVEILRPIAPPMAPPMVRLPKTQTTTTIHYEIIPLPVPMHSEPLAPTFSPAPPPPPPPPPASVPFSYDETDEPSAPWSLDELPPPLPTSPPLNPLDEPNVPWNLHALPPPVATKQPRNHEVFGWPLESGHNSVDGGYPLFDKKLVIPAQGIGSHGHFRPSQLQSEITVQPSVEVAAYSEIQTLAQQPAEYANRLRNLNSPRPQVFPSRNHRLRREAPSAYLIDADRRIVGVSPNRRPAAAAPSVFAPRRSDGEGGSGMRFGSSTARPQSTLPPKPVAVESRRIVPNLDSTRSANAYTRTEYASAGRFAPSIGHDIRVSSESASPERYVLITPRPVNYSRRLHADPARAETRPAPSYSPSGSQPRSSNWLRGSIFDDERRELAEPSAFADRTKGRLRFPPTGTLAKATRRPQHRPSLFWPAQKSPSLSVDDFFGDGPTESPSPESHADQFWRSDYDKVEYFEPIVIDVGGDDDVDKRGRTEFGFENVEPKKSTRGEPLRLPGRLHETAVDRLSEALMHPPIFDVQSDADEPRALLVLVGNRVA